MTDGVLDEVSGLFERDIPGPESKIIRAGRAGVAPGVVIAGTYRLDQLLGSGATASVFAATHLRNANRVAIKVLDPMLERNVEIRTRFLREGYAANSVRHPGTVRALDDGTTETGAAFVVMELLDGETLDSLWARRGGRLPPVEVARLMCALLDVLAAAHANGIVHRDIKPENLFIERGGTLRVLDFGVARVLEGAITETRAGSVIGTLPYMAPEQILGKNREVGARSDLWSVGATAFALVSGRFVHEAETPEEMMVFTGSRQARSLAEVAPDAPAEFIKVVDRALRFDKAERWPSALMMQTAFARACRGKEETEHESPPGERPEADEQMRSLPAGAGSVTEGTPLSPTLVSCDGPGTLLHRARGHRWPQRAAVAFALTFSVAAASSYGQRLTTRAPAMGLTSSVVPSEGLADVIGPEPPEMSPGAPVDPVATVPPTAAEGAPTPAAMGVSGKRETLSPPEAPHAVMSMNPRRSEDRESPTSRPRAPASAAPVSDGCTPPYAIMPVTGKKLWKRECL